jgi:hypothetical protein
MPHQLIERKERSDEYLGLKQLSAYSGLCIRTLRSHLCSLGCALPHYRVGGKILVRRSEFDHWMLGFRKTDGATLNSIVDEILTNL